MMIEGLIVSCVKESCIKFGEKKIEEGSDFSYLKGCSKEGSGVQGNVFKLQESTFR